MLKADYIQTSQTHGCIRKFYILSNGGKELEFEFLPCKTYKDLTLELQQDFIFHKRHVHKLKYIPNIPRQYLPECIAALRKLEKFILVNNIDLILYNGGTLEKDLCTQLDIPSIDVACKNPEMCQKSCVLIYIKMQNFHVQQLRKLNIK